ncbi:2OG-FeII_Oxy_2 domain-containing protein [Cephalotus follicularis]|uniref:2OG-FeII_Oxy_2 domain-containing protein n=1 Tax=Cephalotus follicularis TaxID=3775 RepID=A0A1Q3D4Z4_CEPFO|nr:2OG-FeII_Oxy_2 domain-containing protein [Cephalotus follicularis]
MNENRVKTDHPFLLQYQPSELQIASEFLSRWLPFLSKDLCPHCTEILSDRIRSVDPEHVNTNEDATVSSPNYVESKERNQNFNNNCETNSTGSWKDETDTNSLGSWKDGAEQTPDSSRDGLTDAESPSIEIPSHRLSWADMAQEDELEEEEERQQELIRRVGEFRISKFDDKPKLSRDQREYIRLKSVKRKKDFICFERIKGKLVNILEGLELHEGIFSTAEQKRIVDYVYMLQEMGRKGELKERTFSAPKKWMRGKGRVTIQFGCCYNYATDKNGNPPGILQRETVDPLPHLFKVIIRRLVRWHVIPSTCVPDSCIVNIYDEGDCIPPHIDNHDFVRPFCTVSFLSKCNILFGTNLEILGPGEFSGSSSIPLPVGSVLVLNGNGADVAKHCVPAVPTKRISITFRKMDESKRPFEFLPEPDLQGIQPLPYNLEKTNGLNSAQSEPYMKHQPFRRGRVEAQAFAERRDTRSEPRIRIQTQQGSTSSRRVKINLDR